MAVGSSSQCLVANTEFRKGPFTPRWLSVRLDSVTPSTKTYRAVRGTRYSEKRVVCKSPEASQESIVLPVLAVGNSGIQQRHQFTAAVCNWLEFVQDVFAWRRDFKRYQSLYKKQNKNNRSHASSYRMTCTGSEPVSVQTQDLPAVCQNQPYPRQKQVYHRPLHVGIDGVGN